MALVKIGVRFVTDKDSYSWRIHCFTEVYYTVRSERRENTKTEWRGSLTD